MKLLIMHAAPDVTVLPVYNQNGRLNQLTVQWMQQVIHTVYVYILYDDNSLPSDAIFF